MPKELDDPRRMEPEFTIGEREMLEGWLEFQRITLLLKCEGLQSDELRRRPVATSSLSLHGLVRHLAEVEREWFTRVLLSKPDTPSRYLIEGTKDRDFLPPEGAVFGDDCAAWVAECEQSRLHASAFDLDERGKFEDGTEVSLRWIFVHMIEEYARHNGHADLIREMIDGQTGY